MNKKLKILFIIIFLFSIYHLVRDTLQVLEFHSTFTNVLHREHYWCKPYCNYVTYPLDVLGIIGAYLVLKRDKVGTLGIIVISVLPLWLLLTLLS